MARRDRQGTVTVSAPVGATEATGVPAESEANAEADAKKEADRKIKREAKSRLRSFAQTSEDEQVKSDILLIVGTGQRAARGSVAGQTSELLTLIREAGDEGVSEMDIFMQFHIGQPEMRNKCRLFLKTDKASDRVWVAFDAVKLNYAIVGTGEETPEGWDGYDPNSAKAHEQAEL